MDNINALAQLDWLTVLLGIFIILFGAREIINLIGWYKNKFRIKTGAEEEKDEIKEQISELKKRDDDQDKKIDEMFELVKKINDRTLKESIERCRFEILDMASALGSGRKYTKEQYNHVISTHSRYTELLEENGMTNGQTDASMEIIMESYKERLKEGF